MGLSKICLTLPLVKCFSYLASRWSAWTCSKLLQIARLAGPRPKNTPPKPLEDDKCMS